MYELFILNLIINNISSKNLLFCEKNLPRSYYAVNNCEKIFSEVFEVTDYDSAVKIHKFKIAHSVWPPFFTTFNVFCSNCTKMNIRGFLRSLITIPRSKTRNSRWRIQYGGHFLLNSKLFIQIAQK